MSILKELKRRNVIRVAALYTVVSWLIMQVGELLFTAFEWLQRSLDEDQPMLGIRTDPFLVSLHDDARWDAILAALGLCDAQVAEIEF